MYNHTIIRIERSIKDEFAKLRSEMGQTDPQPSTCSSTKLFKHAGCRLTSPQTIRSTPTAASASSTNPSPSLSGEKVLKRMMSAKFSPAALDEIRYRCGDKPKMKKHNKILKDIQRSGSKAVDIKSRSAAACPDGGETADGSGQR